MTKKKPTRRSSAGTGKKKPRANRTHSTGAGRHASAGGRAISIRMYNVGFGDCFLVRIPTEKGERRILVDCGVHPSGPGPRAIGDVTSDVIRECSDGAGPRIDVVIATHRHADHVSGFSKSAWDAVEVGEVWLPWTEDPDDPKARKILKTQSTTALALAAMLAATPNAPAAILAANSLTNAAAMDTLHRGFRGDARRRFLPRADAGVESFTTGSLPGVTIHVLGPSRDPEVIRDMEPAEGESFLSGSASGGTAAAEPAFPSQWVVDPEQLEQIAPYELVGPDDAAKMKRLGDVDALAVAVALEKAVNGTSLMLVLQFGRAFLLFPGDAQWGTWTRALADDRSRDLLSKTTFYKVGHHGSHNATPPLFVQQVLGTKFAAMASTREKTKDWDIPRMPLLNAMRARCDNVVRSDREDENDPSDFTRDGDNFFVDLKLEC